MPAVYRLDTPESISDSSALKIYGRLSERLNTSTFGPSQLLLHRETMAVALLARVGYAPPHGGLAIGKAGRFTYLLLALRL
jgi:hypothetical protein